MNKMSIRVTSTAPGSEGELVTMMTQEQYEFMCEFVLAWNEANPLHSQPSLIVEPT